ncbi:kinase [Nisaea sp.]|uniref:GHMP family kinase ATP-binding protein n=1 Tax=Nisaea sp. TaxID=2024842 RepID=UPI0032EE6761
MIISRTPFRVSLFGGGTDYPAWYHKNGGAVLGFSIDKYCYISIRRLPPFFEHKHRIVYSRVENVTETAEIQHPAVRAIFNEMPVDHGLEIHCDADLPARSGIGSSSSFAVGLLNAMHAHRGQHVGKDVLAQSAIHIEQNVIGENVGSQDQIWAAHGGFNRIDFHHSGSYSIQPVIMPQKRQAALLDHLLLFFTGFSRISSEIAKDHIENLEAKHGHLTRMRGLVDDALNCLQSDAPIEDIGEMLHQSWSLKRELSKKVTTEAIDEIYLRGRAAGAIGGKILGAGGGGFILFFAPPEKRAKIRRALSSLTEVSIGIDYSGSSIALYQPEITSS